MRSFFDTKVLVYLFDDDAPEKQRRAQQLLQDEVGQGRAILSTQVLQEFYVTVTRKLASPLGIGAPKPLQSIEPTESCVLGASGVGDTRLYR